MKPLTTVTPTVKHSLQAKKLYYVLLGLVGLGLIIGLFGYLRLQKQLGQKINDLSKISADIVLANQQIENLRQLQTDYLAVKPLADKVQQVLPPQKNQAEVVGQISTIVQNDRLSLSDLSFDSTQGLPNDKSQTQPANGISGTFLMPVRFETIGSYRQLEALLRDFESEQRFMRVSTLEITRTDQGNLDANITLEVFFKP